MDLRIKIIIVIFIVIVVGYAIYFVFNDFVKQKKSDGQTKKITETFEDYDIRQHILAELDTYDIDKKTKSSIYDAMSGKIETFKEMSQDDIEAKIKEMVEKTKDTITKTKEAAKNLGKTAESFYERTMKKRKEAEDEAEPVPKPTSAVIKKAAESTRPPKVNSMSEVMAADEEEKEGFAADSLTSDDIVGVIDDLQTKIDKIKNIVQNMPAQCRRPAPAPPSVLQTLEDAIDKATHPKAAVTVSAAPAPAAARPELTRPTPAVAVAKPAAKATIEGFENFGGRGYAFI